MDAICPSSPSPRHNPLRPPAWRVLARRVLAWRWAACLLLALLAMLPAGCIQIAKSTGLPNPFAVERPYEGRHRNPIAVKGILRGASFVVFPIAGMPGGEGMALAIELREAAAARDIPVSVTKGASTADQLLGRARLHQTEAGIWIEVFWQVVNRSGGVIQGFSVSRRLREPDQSRSTLPLTVGMPLIGFPEAEAWNFLKEADVEAIAQATADRIQFMLEEAQGRDPVREVVRRRIILRPVAGAPGDGQVSLTRMLASRLGEANFDVDTRWQMEAGPVPNDAVVVTGSVAVEPQVVSGVLAGDKVTLTWSVHDHRGRHMGTVSQSNMVPPGRLNGPWEEIAVYAAEGARQGILDLLANMPVP